MAAVVRAAKVAVAGSGYAVAISKVPHSLAFSTGAGAVPLPVQQV
jgi:hypothetical protein